MPEQSCHAVLAVNGERDDALAARDGGLLSLTAALRRGAKPAGNPAHDHRTTLMTTLYVLDGLSFREAESHHVIRQAQVLIARRFRPGAPVLSRPKEVRDFLRLRLGSLDHEVFCCFYLDSRRRRLIAFEELFRGTVDCAQVHPRDVLRQAPVPEANVGRPPSKPESATPSRVIRMFEPRYGRCPLWSPFD
ncbi:MAG: hypothetical protein KGO22_06460 [Gammaproteobacteria bacterium]|nr:hypothetical protein [Gammaproteobacteria bacterium]